MYCTYTCVPCQGKMQYLPFALKEYNFEIATTISILPSALKRQIKNTIFRFLLFKVRGHNYQVCNSQQLIRSPSVSRNRERNWQLFLPFIWFDRTILHVFIVI